MKNWKTPKISLVTNRLRNQMRNRKFGVSCEDWSLKRPNSERDNSED